MKTIFHMGLPNNNMFWMGQQTGTLTAGGIDYAMNLYSQTAAWVNAHPSGQDVLLGSDYAAFQQQWALAYSLIGDVSQYAATLDAGGTLTGQQNDEANQFASAIAAAWAYIVQHPAPTAVQAATPAAAPLGPPLVPTVRPAARPATPAAKPVPAPAPAAGPSPLLIGGGVAVVGIAVLALVLRS